MSNKSKKYGVYYGELVNFKSNPKLIYNDWSYDTPELLQKLYDVGVKEIFLDIEDSNDYSSTLFFETDENTNFRKLLLIIAEFRPDEFSEETPHHFRMWFD